MLNVNKKQIFGTIFIAAGLIIIAAAISMRLWTCRKQSEMISRAENIKSAVQITQEDVIGILYIPKINLTAAIGEDTNMSTLKYSVGHFKSTAFPGEKGNCCIAGHRSYTYGEFFNRLDELEKGDEIIIKTNFGTFKYMIDEKFTVEPTQTEVLNQTENAILTLVTCTPVRAATHRLIIRASLLY